MDLLNSRKTKARKTYETYWESYSKGDLETFASTLDDHYEMIGTSETEVCHSKADGIAFLKAQMHEVVGKTEMRNRQIEVLPVENLMLINEQCDVYVLTDSDLPADTPYLSAGRQDWNFYSKIRLSTILRETESGWKVTQQHGSFPDMRVQEGETLALEKINKENLELRDAVKRRTAELENKNRELAIEAALEKVRAVAMGMKNPKAMLDVCRVIAEQLEEFGVTKIRNVQTAIIDEHIGQYLCYQYFTPYDKTTTEKTEYLKSPVEHSMVKQMLASRDGYFIGGLSGMELEDFRIHRKEEHHFPDPFLDEATQLDYCFLSIGEGGLGLTLYQPIAEEILTLFKRFHQVFSLAYQRFRDIQKAEAQAREAEIELALERVRARTMAMHHTEELKEVIQVVFDQFVGLNIHVEHAGFILDYMEREDMHIWLADQQQGVPTEITIPYFDSPHWNSYRKAKAKEESFFANLLPFDVKNKFYRDLFEWIPELTEEAQQAIFSKPALAISTVLLDNVGLYIEHYSATPFTAGENAILMRFGKVFEQTYTRFLDLQKAEAQGREAQIQLALERVRARTMAMQKSDELPEAANLLFQQIQSLGMPAWSAGYCTWKEDLPTEKEGKSAVTLWMSSEGVLQPPFTAPTTEDKLFIQMREGAEKGMDLHVVEMGGEELEQHYRYMRELPVVGEILDSIIEAGHPLPTFQIMHQAYFSKGFLLFITYEPVPEAHEIFKRFANVFDQTYTRFLDLQKAEAQAREAKIEAALEKVRSRSLAMHKSDELNDVVAVLFEKLKELQIPSSAVGIGIYIDGTKDLNAFVCGENETGLVISNYRFPYFDHKISADFNKVREEHLDLFVGHYLKEEKNAFYEYLFEHAAALRQLPQDIKRMIFQSPSYTITMAAVKNAIFSINDFEGKNLSEYEIDIIQRFAKVFDQAYTRFLDLQKAEAQAREAEIELGLERVRARAMAMQHSDELAELVATVFRELNHLDFSLASCIIWIHDPSNKSNALWIASEEMNKPARPLQIVPFYPPFFNSIIAAWKAKDPQWIFSLTGGEKKKFEKLFFKQYPELPEALKKPVSQNKQITFSASFNNFGALEIVATEPLTNEKFEILHRFGKVFDSSYTRFNDLQKAEAQAREAQIEAALERVRSRSMAMQKPDELVEVAELLREEMGRLGVEELETSSIYLVDSENMHAECWYAIKDIRDGDRMLVSDEMTLLLPDTWVGREMWKFFQSKKEQTSIVMMGDNRKDWINYCADRSQVLQGYYGNEIPERTYHLVKFNGGYMGAASPGEISPASWDLLKRAAAVFSFAYTRFKDLQDAAARAREAQIELAMEKVRGRTMAMQSSDELADAAYVLFEQLNFLGVTHERINIGIVNEENQTIDFWVTEQGGDKLSTKFSGRISEPTTLSKAYSAWKQGAKSLVVDLQGDELKSWLIYLNNEIKIPFNKAFLHKRRVQTAGFFSKGMLVVTSPEPLQEEALYLLEKFAGVFDLTYTRFSDLKQAEAQARDAQVEVAMERIRARALAMQSSDELIFVAGALREQMGLLGQEDLEATVVHLYEPGSPTFDSWYAFKPPGKTTKDIITGIATFHFENSALAKDFLALYEDPTTEYTLEVKGEILKEWLTEIGKNAPQIAAYWGDLPPEKQFYHFSDFSGGALLMVSHENLTEETRMLQKRCASVFELAYKRFLDLESKERQEKELLEEKKRLEQALIELKATQSQLIQQEKLASLGQLTAGIAHEIKNPLNFVNNFSEVSIEMIEEILDSRLKTQDTRLRTEADEIEDEILEDVKANLAKIHEHGSRANGIVTSMLQHSRGGTGKKEPTDLNALIKEYVNLSFHGMRAGKNPIDMEIVLDLDPDVKEVSLVKEDFSRVIINLCNNAFDAMRGKVDLPGFENLAGLKDYHPKLTVRTKSEKDLILIEVEDNGPGIPDEIKDKILQPFFTTKKGTEGTGLGLSITHDIVKAHGGELRVETKDGEGSTFIITLPITTS
jgi:signal transduction histidine kinase/DNA-directed RNA polymerase subunit N (RpoN/RPB10)